jgi:membrane protein YdbS with pleckstrin-like domain
MSDEGGREVVIARLRPHARALFWPTVLLIAVAAAYGFFGDRFPEAWQNIAVAATAGLLVVVGWLAPVLRWASRTYTITSRRTVVRSGAVVRSRQEVLHSRVLSVTVHTTWLQTLMRSGDVELEVGADRPVVLRDVPSAILAAEVFQDLAETN